MWLRLSMCPVAHMYAGSTHTNSEDQLTGAGLQIFTVHLVVSAEGVSAQYLGAFKGHLYAHMRPIHPKSPQATRTTVEPARRASAFNRAWYQCFHAGGGEAGPGQECQGAVNTHLHFQRGRRKNKN